MHGCSVDHQVDVIGDVGCCLTVHNLRSGCCQMVSQLTLMGVRTADAKALPHQNLCQAAHADAADSNKMNSNGFLKIYLIHTGFHPFLMFILFLYNMLLHILFLFTSFSMKSQCFSSLSTQIVI